jgi:hypothetical protein
MAARGINNLVKECELVSQVRRNIHLWEITASSKTAQCIKSGFQIEWKNLPPPKTHLKNHPIKQQDLEFVSEEIGRLLQMGAISPVKRKKLTIINPIGIVPKKNGKKRMIIDMRFVNSFMKVPKFKLEDLRTAINLMEPLDWMIKIDLQDGYFHAPIHQKYRRFLGFTWQGKTFQYNVLPFGMAISPLCFTKFLRPMVQFFREMGLRVVSYVDDFIFFIKNPTVRKIQGIVDTFQAFGLKINQQKSVLTPSQKLEFLGMVLDSKKMMIKAPKSKIRNAIREAQYIKKKLLNEEPVTKRSLARFAGLAIAISKAIIPAKLMLRFVYKAMSSVQQWGEKIQASEQLLSDLDWWIENLKSWNGKSLLSKDPDIHLFVDASRSGWGAICEGLEAAGFWSRRDSQRPSNQRELLAVIKAILSFLDLLKRKKVMIHSDNITTVCLINQTAGRTTQLNLINRTLLSILTTHNIEVAAIHIPGKSNVKADELSRLRDKSDWMLNRDIFQKLDTIWGPHTVDRFATDLNAQTRRFNSMRRCPGSEAVNAFTQDWSKDNNWINPPFSMLQLVINKIIRQRATATIVAPIWRAQPWFQKLLNITSQIILLPNHEATFLPGFKGNAEPLKNPGWQVAAFRVSGKLWHPTGRKIQFHY